MEQLNFEFLDDSIIESVRRFRAVLDAAENFQDSSLRARMEIIKALGFTSERLSEICGISVEAVETIYNDPSCLRDARIPLSVSSLQRLNGILIVAYNTLTPPDRQLKTLLCSLPTWVFAETLTKLTRIPTDAIEAFITDKSDLSDSDKYRLAMAAMKLAVALRDAQDERLFIDEPEQQANG
ncbi:MAG: hypothetical protein LBC28_02960 [Oscillospiraceae bacterium]|jgi:hypothetical protein|nr:hypothetical protein [Oscillospiraceae bacterium]